MNATKNELLNAAQAFGEAAAELTTLQSPEDLAAILESVEAAVARLRDLIVIVPQGPACAGHADRHEKNREAGRNPPEPKGRRPKPTPAPPPPPPNETTTRGVPPPGVGA
jgi:hypothetical protein